MLFALERVGFVGFVITSVEVFYSFGGYITQTIYC